LENSFENALSISQLKDEFNQSLPADCSPASNRDIKNNLRATFGDRVKFVIRKGCIADSVVLEKASPERLNNKDDEILRAAAELIVADIKKLPETGKDTYTNTETLEGCSLAHVPTTLLKFLRIVLVEKDDKKLSAIGQAIVHVSRPRSYLAPIQMGLAIELHAMFRSRFLVETLHALGFCSSYSEVMEFEKNAAITMEPELKNLGISTDGLFLFAADNVDHNLITLDGQNTFHGMGMIAALTPGNFQRPAIPRKKVLPGALKAVSSIPIIDIYYNYLLLLLLR
jgi:hypothetical protein